MSTLKDAIANAGGIPNGFSKDDPVGRIVTGRILDAELKQTTSFDTGEPETWSDGSPKQQVILTLSTSEATGPDDDGKRRIYIKWWGDQRKELLRAIQAAGDDDVRPGGTFTATFAGLGEAPNPRFNAPKLYRYEYVKPAAGIAQQQGQQQATPDYQAPQQTAQPAAQPATTHIPAEVQQQVRNLANNNLDSQMIANALSLSITDVETIRNTAA